MITINGDPGVGDALKSVGYQATYATKWLGPWSDTAADIDGFINLCKSKGWKPAFQFFYWGDEIALETLKGTYTPKEYGGESETVGEYWKHVKLMTERIRVSGIQGALVSIESEWNKRGPNVPNWLQSVTAEPAVFDQLFADTANYIKTNAPSTKIVTCPGQWSNLATLLPRFPKMLQTTDFVATQGLNTLYRQSEASYIAGVDRLLAKMKELQTGGGGKPIIIMDTAWSTYGGSYVQEGDPKAHHYAPVHPATAESNLRVGEASQAKALSRFRELLPQFEAAGLKHLFYRGIRDVRMDINNYWGYFEWGWGVIRLDGTKKPGFSHLMALSQSDPTEAATPLETCQKDLEAQKVISANAIAQRDEAMHTVASLRSKLEQINALSR